MRAPLDDWSYWLMQVEQHTRRANEMLTNHPAGLPLKGNAELEAELMSIAFSAQKVLEWVARH